MNIFAIAFLCFKMVVSKFKGLPPVLFNKW
jgi:hypothetical protein